MIITQEQLSNPKYADFTPEAWGAWLLAALHCEHAGTDTLTDTQFITTTRIMSMHTATLLADAGLLVKQEDGTNCIMSPVVDDA